MRQRLTGFANLEPVDGLLSMFGEFDVYLTLCSVRGVNPYSELYPAVHYCTDQTISTPRREGTISDTINLYLTSITALVVARFRNIQTSLRIVLAKLR